MKKTKVVDIKFPKNWNKVVIEKKMIDFNDFDILDGRTHSGKPFRKIAKLMDLLLYVLGCATLSAIIVYTFFKWIA